jgi:hypothetical protein
LKLAQTVLGIDHSLMQLLVVSGICAAMAAQVPAEDGGSPDDLLLRFADAFRHAYNQTRNTLARIAGIGASMTRRIRHGER